MINNKNDGTIHLPDELCIRMAAQIEQQLLPQTSPQIEGAEIAGWTLFSHSLGGDFFDYHDFQGVCCKSASRMNVVVGDACGHGLCSALLMTSTRSLLRARAMHAGQISQVVTDVNVLLHMDIKESGHFITLFYMSIYGPEKRIEWVRAGHPPALLYDPVKDEFISLYGEGVTLGVDPEYVYQSNSRTHLPDGAIVLIGSDGLWEMESGADESSCKKVLTDLVRKHRTGTAEVISQVIKKQVELWCCNQAAQDDVSLVVVKFVNE
ncbi:MAG: sigma-B regulation protein RsbU (phosphoserine phosphatase) [Desulforhopalus sp.]|jgi:sigma-B regulation protein RsbU (phosphoserine phosphatase)